MYFVIVETWRQLNVNPGLNSYPVSFPVSYWAVLLNCLLDRKYVLNVCF